MMTNKKRAIPEGYMTVGEVAGKMGVTVRTLQYYDREGLLSPTAESEGGRRLYTDRDVIKLHQILSLKRLGFSLDHIKNRLTALDSPEAVAAALEEQAAAVREKVRNLSESLRALEMLREEVLQIQEVDFSKYADIIVNLEMKNEFYWMIKHFDDETLEYLHGRFDQDSGRTMMDRSTRLLTEAARLQEEGVLPDSERGQSFAKKFWDMIMEFTGGDLGIVSRLMKTENFNGEEDRGQQRQAETNFFIGTALGAYFEKIGYHPFGEGAE